MDVNKEVLDEDPESLAIEADETIQYDPFEDSNVVAVEPIIVTLGRKKRKDAVRKMQEESGHE